MASEENFEESTRHFEYGRDVSLKQKWKSMPVPAIAADNKTGCFDCNICFDSAQDPVVTLCGHLYCWPCIYKWLHVQSSSPESDDEQAKCPVCKANISPSTLVPLYGRGASPLSETEAKKPQLDVIPRRPRALGINTLLTNHQLRPNPFWSQPQSPDRRQYFPHRFSNYASMTSSNVGGTTMTSFSSPTAGMFGEMVFARMFGSSDASSFAYPNTYAVTGSSSPRMRRQEMQVDKSLNRVSIFLFCCFILCLLLF